MGDEILAAYAAAEGKLEALEAAVRHARAALVALNADPTLSEAIEALESAATLLAEETCDAVEALDAFIPIAERMRKPIEF